MSPPALLHNTGQRGEFILPLNIPSATGGAEDKYDDFTFDAVSWTLIAMLPGGVADTIDAHDDQHHSDLTRTA